MGDSLYVLPRVAVVIAVLGLLPLAFRWVSSAAQAFFSSDWGLSRHPHRPARVQLER